MIHTIKVYLTLGVLFGVGFTASAQSTTPVAPRDDHALGQSMTLSACVRYAQEHSPRLLPTEGRIQALDLSVSVARQSFLPSLNASIGETASFGRSQAKNGVYQDVSSANTDFQIGASLEIFTGGRRWWSLKQSQAELKTKDYIIAEAKDQIALSVTEDYTSLLLAQQIVEVARENLKLSTTLLEQTKMQVEIGKLPYSQQIQIESQVGQDQLTLTEAEADLDRALRILLLDMGVDDPSISIQLPTLKPEEIATRLQAFDFSTHKEDWMPPTTRIALSQYELSDYDIKKAKAGYWPSLTLNGGYSNGYFYSFGTNITPEMNPSFRDQLRQNGRYFVGLSLNIPIYNKGQITSQVRQAQIQKLNLHSQFVQQKYNDKRNITLATAELKKAEEQYRISAQNATLNEKALVIAEMEYKAGRITVYDWDQARNKYLVAKGNYLRSIYNRLLRTINLSYFYSGQLPLSLAE